MGFFPFMTSPRFAQCCLRVVEMPEDKMFALWLLLQKDLPKVLSFSASLMWLFQMCWSTSDPAGHTFWSSGIRV